MPEGAWRPLTGLLLACFGCGLEGEPDDDRMLSRIGNGELPAGARWESNTFTAGLPAQVVSPERVRIAFFGDTANGRGFEQVLQLVRREGADAVVHLGDFDYRDDPAGFFATVDRVLGADFPYFAAAGNHDHDAWPGPRGYAGLLGARFARIGAELDHPDLDDQMYSLSFRGVKLVFIGEDGRNEEYARYLRQQLAGDLHQVKVCAWHRNQTAMQLGRKGNEMGWEVYEICREHGAIIATAHEHSYTRTRTLVDMDAQRVDPACEERERACVERGRTFAFVSGLGGHSIREQARCRPTAYPYGCNQEWAMVYASDQGARFGALFLEFDGAEAQRARGYFRSVQDETIDDFAIEF